MLHHMKRSKCGDGMCCNPWKEWTVCGIVAARENHETRKRIVRRETDVPSDERA